jgi:hypothetical protein
MSPVSNKNLSEVAQEIAGAERDLDAKARRLWERIRIAPVLWKQRQYPDEANQYSERFWVVAIMGTRCLYFNHVEGGWGWGRFAEWGNVAEYHWQQDEIQLVIVQTLFAIDEGGAG